MRLRIHKMRSEANLYTQKDSERSSHGLVVISFTTDATRRLKPRVLLTIVLTMYCYHLSLELSVET